MELEDDGGENILGGTVVLTAVRSLFTWSYFLSTQDPSQYGYNPILARISRIPSFCKDRVSGLQNFPVGLNTQGIGMAQS